METVTLPPFLVVFVAAAPCLIKDIHINGYEKKTWKHLMQMIVYHYMLQTM